MAIATEIVMFWEEIPIVLLQLFAKYYAQFLISIFLYWEKAFQLTEVIDYQ